MMGKHVAPVGQAVCPIPGGQIGVLVHDVLELIHRAAVGQEEEAVFGVEQGFPRRSSAIIHRTVRCATRQCPVHQGISVRTLHLRVSQAHLSYNSPDCPV